MIHGSVESGVTIKATGSITIDGNVEACNLEAGKDIILRSGMVGGNKAHVRTKGNLYAKFIEYTVIQVEGRYGGRRIAQLHSCVQRIYSDPGQNSEDHR